MDTTEGANVAGRLLDEHHDLVSSICTIREWIKGVSELGRPRFGELGMQLEPFRKTLANHFADEESIEISGALKESAGHAAMNRTELAEVHNKILQRLDKLIQCLRATQPGFCSWQEAVKEAESVLTDVCAYEESEKNLLQAMLPHP